MKTKIFSLLFAIVASATMANAMKTYSVSEAIDAFDAGTLKTGDSCQVVGVISKWCPKSTSFSTYKSVSYYVTDGTKEFQFYCSYSLNKAKYQNYDYSSDTTASCIDINGVSLFLGDTVIGVGKIKKFGDIYEFDMDCYLKEIHSARNFPVIIAQGTCGDSATWTMSYPDWTVTISGKGSLETNPWDTYKSFITLVKINEGITSIGDNAFRDCTSLTSIIISNSVTNIGDAAFKDCSSLISINLPDSVTDIRNSTFQGCTSLTSVSIPNSVTSIGSFAFRYCTSLTSVILPNSVISIGRSAFTGCSSLTSPVYNVRIFAFLPVSYSGAYTIPSGIESIAGGALYACKGLISVTIPNSVTSIGSQAFCQCTSLISVTIPNSVTSIENQAFYQCTSLTSVSIPNSVTNIGEYAFYNCTSLTSVTLPNSVTSIEQGTFCQCTSLISVTIPNSVTSIGNGAFLNCTALASIEIPNSITSIGDDAFSGCSSLASIVIPNSVTSIESATFSGCSGLISIEIPYGVVSIGDGAFQNCIGLNSIVIPYAVASIGTRAFNGCTGLLSVDMIPTEPPTLDGTNHFPTNTTIYVPCGQLETYQKAEGWSSYASNIKQKVSKISVSTYPIIGGFIEERTDSAYVNVCDSFSLTAVANYGYHFTQWSDGNTDNPRIIKVPHDTTFIAEFAIDKSGVCGADNALTWEYEEKSKTLTISGSGELTENYTFGLEAPEQMQTLVIGNEVTAIGDSAFYAKATINHLFIGSNVASIGNHTFAECKNFDDITCYATTVPTINATTFENVGNKQYIYLYVPADRERAYKRDTYWGQFDVQIQSAESITTDAIKIDPTDNSAAVTWPTIDGADSYELVIRDKEGNVICTLIFNAQGQLTSISFAAPSRDGAPQQTQVAGFAFTITGLEGGTSYDLTITAKDSSGNTLDVKTVSFTTEGDAPQGIDDINAATKSQKIVRDGKVYILRGEKTYTVTGQEVK